MDYSSTYFVTLLVFTHDKLAVALKQLVKFPWRGVYATLASLIRATKDARYIAFAYTRSLRNQNFCHTHCHCWWTLKLSEGKVSCSAPYSGFVPWDVFSWEVPPDTIVSRGDC